MTTRFRLRPSTRRERRHGLLAVAVVLLLAVVLDWTTTDGESTSDVIDEGDILDLSSPLHASSSHEVRVPGARIDLWVDDPVDEVAGGVADDVTYTEVDPMRPAPGSHLVPVTVRLRPLPGILASSEPDTQEIGIRLVHDETTVELSSGTAKELRGEPARSMVVAVDEDTDLDDITIEVEYDDLTQALALGNGDIESGAAAPLYEEASSLSTGCGEFDGCHLAAVGKDTRWRPLPSEAELTTGSVVRRSYDHELGWADEGKVWASVAVRLNSPTSVRNVDGLSRDTHAGGEPAITLDQNSPKGDLREMNRRVVTFSIDADSSPRQLTVEQRLSLLDRETPRRVTLRKTMNLAEAE